ncbi:ICMT-domain-containing protein [Trametes coccinea BRFM310]|uniref:Protein-S-isoprenylcysteine O-methyltransferase n=1 Tax=Trametes coccinea (strain BRFM310) TaxID=1353009 RepID=A0A1Y2IGU2_TRAC3|nr:ICMT-domain-containing protein [Trametes coccinea BRFM310]
MPSVNPAASPLLKVPLLLAHSVCTYYGMTPSTPLPKPEEQKRYDASEFMARTMRVQIVLVSAGKWTCCGFALAEAAAILAAYLPSKIPGHVHSLLLPNGASLQLTPTSAVACALGITGGLMRIWCYRTLGQNFTWSTSIQPKHKLGTSGPYAIVRHPSYTAWTMMMLGNFILLLSKGSYAAESGLLGRPFGKAFVFTLIGYISFFTFTLTVRRTRLEDAILKEEFGKEWEEWAKKTPYRLFPYVY